MKNIVKIVLLLFLILGCNNCNSKNNSIQSANVTSFEKIEYDAWSYTYSDFSEWIILRKDERGFFLVNKNGTLISLNIFIKDDNNSITHYALGERGFIRQTIFTDLRQLGYHISDIENNFIERNYETIDIFKIKNTGFAFIQDWTWTYQDKKYLFFCGNGKRPEIAEGTCARLAGGLMIKNNRLEP